VEERIGASPKCALRFAWPEAPALSLDGYDDHPRVHAAARMVEGRFAAVLAPLDEGADVPQVSGSEGRLTVDFGSVEDTMDVRYSRQTPAAWRLTRAVGGERRWEMASEHSE